MTRKNKWPLCYRLGVYSALLCLFATGAASGQATAPRQGAALLKTDILYVCAHPDDEVGVAATLARYGLGRGLVTASVYCTRGEGGGNMVGTQAGPALGLLREVELRDALAKLGVRHLFFLDQVDWAYTESRAATERKWDREAALRSLVRIYRALRPEVVLTMNPAPVPGQHGHHQAAGVLATEAFDAAADPLRFPEQLTREGLTTWQPRKLYYSDWSGGTIQIPTTDRLPDGRTFAQVAGEAMSNHRSQAFGNFGDSPFMRRPQSFTLVKSVVPIAEPETDLLQGVPGHDPNAPPLLVSFQPERYQAAPGQPIPISYRITNLSDAHLPFHVKLRAPADWQVTESVRPLAAIPPGETVKGSLAAVPPVSATGRREQITGTVVLGEREVTTPIPVEIVAPLTLRFVARPATERYLAWCKERRVEHVAAQLPTDLPLIAGEPNRIVLAIENRGESEAQGRIRISAPAGWRVAPDVLTYRAESNMTLERRIQVTPPSDASADAEIVAVAEQDGKTVVATARAHPLPRLRVTRVERPLPLEGTGRGWEKIPAQRITPAMRAEGESKSEADSSATFRLAHDGETLYVDVDVRDDVVVSNIAPNDIKGHWRSDSVEVCVDPQGGAEDTLGCFKVGIFPFDTTGRVRAARDADARQGPVEETAPTMRLVSARTPAGYRIQAAIPFKELGVEPRRGRRLGFNLILYDGDRANAAPGENINESRLAWAPRPGVMGRPEDWGRAELE